MLLRLAFYAFILVKLGGTQLNSGLRYRRHNYSLYVIPEHPDEAAFAHGGAFVGIPQNSTGEQNQQQIPLSSLEKHWNDVVQECRTILDDEDDYNTIIAFEKHEQVLNFTQLEDMTAKHEKGSLTHQLHNIIRTINAIKSCISVIAIGLGAADLKMTYLFGSVSLMIDLASHSDQTLIEVIGILNEFGDHLRLFNSHHRPTDIDPQPLQALFEILVKFTINVTTAIKHFRVYPEAVLLSDPERSEMGSNSANNLQSLEARQDNLQSLDDPKRHDEAVLSQTDLIRTLGLLSLQSSWEGRSFRCQTIPFIRNSQFVARDQTLKEIQQAFEQQLVPLKSVAIWGTGGIGKTQIALEFVYREWYDRSDYVILWIASETIDEVSHSFANAAEKLHLEGYAESNTPDQNRDLVLRWLQITSIPWLLVFDNVEEQDILKSNWPARGNGKILITCRSELLAPSSLISKTIEVNTLTIDQSMELFLGLLHKPFVKEQKTEATKSLMEQLGGLPLAINIIASKIENSPRYKSADDFLPYYMQNQNAVLKEGSKYDSFYTTYSKDISTVWKVAFDSLSLIAIELMQLLCFMSPDLIPDTLFKVQSSGNESQWEILQQSDIFEAAKLELQRLSLIRTNKDTGTISIHRLTQGAYLERMSEEDWWSTFYMAQSLLRAEFPVHFNGHLYRLWPICAPIHPHVLTLRHRFQTRTSPRSLGPNSHGYVSLMLDDIWYMIEIQWFREAEAALLTLIPETRNDPSLTIRIYKCLMGVYERSGRSNKAMEYGKAELDLYLASGFPRNNVCANAYSNRGYSLVSAMKASEALQYLDTAVSIALDDGSPYFWKTYNIDRFLRNRARAKYQMGRFDESLSDLDEADAYQNKIHGEHSHYEGETKHERAKIVASRGELEEAYRMNEEALKLVSKGKPTYSGVMASQYRLGWVSMLQGRDMQALEHLEKALAICQLNEPQRGNSGDSARVKWRMSQIYTRLNMTEKANAYLVAAETCKKELLATGDYAIVEDEDESWDALVGLLYR